MGLFADTANAKASFGQDYAKPGDYFIIVEAGKHGKHASKGVEQAVFECSYLHVVDKALWTGDPKLVPTGEKGQHLLNLPGEEPKPGQPISFIFQKGQKGAENRLKKFIITCFDCKDEDFPTGERGEKEVASIFGPLQPLKSVVIQVKAGEQTTQSNKKIVGANPTRRVWAEELRQLWEANRLDQATIDLLSKEKRIEKMIAMEAEERKSKSAPVAAAK